MIKNSFFRQQNEYIDLSTSAYFPLEFIQIMASVTVGIQWSWICSTITNHRKMNTLYEWKVHATIPVAGISSEDAWERYQTNYMESLNEPEAFWTTVSSDHLCAFLTICKNFSMDIFDSADEFSSIWQCVYSNSKRTIMYHGSLLSRKSRLDPS